MRGKKHDVCHDCRRRKCDGCKPACSQCRMTGRLCRGYLQDLVVFHHDPVIRRRRSGRKAASRPIATSTESDRLQETSVPSSDATCTLASALQQPTWDECVAILVEHYIPKDEIPFLLHVEPSKSRICGGWVQALPHVSQGHEDFKHIVSPAVRALTMAMMVSDKDKRTQYLDTYGAALEGIRAVLERQTDSVGPSVAIACMCLALSEALVPSSSNGYKTHLRGVAAMMQSRGPIAFKEGVAHLMFVGVRPLIVLDAIIRRKTTFLMDQQWQQIPFSVHPAPRMQMLLGYAAAIPPLLEALEHNNLDQHVIRTGFLNILVTLQDWETEFLSEGTLYRTIAPSELDLAADPKRLPNPCFDFADVSHANSLTHCWAFRVVCLLQLSKLDTLLDDSRGTTCFTQRKYHADVELLCKMICQGLPYLLQKEMRLYGSMSVGFPLHMVSESLQTLRTQNYDIGTWLAAIEEQMRLQSIALYEEMAETGLCF